MIKNQLQTTESGEAGCSGAVVQVFSKVVDAHRLQIFRFLLASSRDPDLAETLTQECFLKAYCNWTSFRGESSAISWLMRIAINLQKDHWRSQKTQFWRQTHANGMDADQASERLPSGESSPEERTSAREQVRLVWRAVDNLSERQRTVFLLRFVEELTVSEIARATGMQEGTAKAHLSRARMRVRAALAGQGALRTRQAYTGSRQIQETLILNVVALDAIHDEQDFATTIVERPRPRNTFK
jgi:RNA polymerase sigma-70 factor (ECF subfamily)